MPGPAQGRPGRGAGSPKSGLRGSLTAAFAADIAVEIDALAGAGAADGIDFEALETGVRRRALALAARLVERRLTRTGATARGRRCRAAAAPGRRTPGGARELRGDGTLLHDLAGVNVDAKQAERTAEALGREIAADEREVVAAGPGRAPTMYLGMDGTGVPVRRAELAGRAGKQADGSARTREAKLVAVRAGAVDARGPDLPEREPGSVSYSAAVESAAARDTDAEPSPFARRVEREARRRGFDRASRQVVIGDGAPWIWNIADMSFPDAVEIVDLFHAKQHLWDVAKAIYGPGTDTAERWAKRRRDELDDGRIGALLAALRRHQGRDEARRCIGYVRRNRHRMQYPKFRAMGLCVGSGVVEAGCKHILGTRCKRPGMHWSVNGVNAIAALRCCVLGNRFDSF